MPAKLITTVNRIALIPNSVNSSLAREFHQHLIINGASERHQNNCLKAVIAFSNHLGPGMSFYNIQGREQITSFLDTKRKSIEQDPDKKWITTWNHYLIHIKLFLRWLYNCRGKSEDRIPPQSEWETPTIVRIKELKTKRLSPYSESQIWDRDELLTIVKYEPYIRNKAALTLFWDLDARNHEVTVLKIRNIRLGERYGEGEIPHNTKTGGGPILLACSFPYVRDWLNKHPFKNSPEVNLICNLHNGAPVRPEAMWSMMKQLQKRIIRMLENGSIKDAKERKKLEDLIRTKKWNPYCLRHSAITSDSDYLPEFAIKKKARWSMNSRQGSRYIKNRMGNDLKRTILKQSGIYVDDDDALKCKPPIIMCPRCELINQIEKKYCSKCSYPLVPSAFDEIKLAEEERIRELGKKYEEELNHMREDICALKESQAEFSNLL